MNEKKIVIWSISLFFLWIILVYYVWFTLNWDKFTLNNSENYENTLSNINTNQAISKEDISSNDYDGDKYDNKNDDLLNLDESFVDFIKSDNEKDEVVLPNKSDEIRISEWFASNNPLLITNYTRQQLASLYINYYTEFLGWNLERINTACDFDDFADMDPQLIWDVIVACEAWIFRWHWKYFYPNGIVSFDEIIIWAIRLMDASKRNSSIQILYSWKSYISEKSIENEIKNIISIPMLQDFIVVLFDEGSDWIKSVSVVQSNQWYLKSYQAVYK